MSSYPNACPPEYLDEEDSDNYEEFLMPSANPPNSLFNCSTSNCPEIKIIPKLGVESGINKTDFDIHLDVNSQAWFDRIHQYWRQFKKSPVFSNVIQQFFSSSPHPFVYGLKFFANATDHPNPKNNSFAYTILDELLNYKKNFMTVSPQIFLDDNTKMVAFNFLKRSGQTSAFKLAVETFELVKSKHLFVSEIRDLIVNKHFKEAGQIACDLHLFNEFTMDDFLIPLILEDKLGIFEDYLDKATHLRSPTIELLDTFLQRDTTVRQMCDIYIAKYDLKDVKYEKLHKKPVSKLVGRLMKKYHLPESIAPNMKKHKEFGSLHFILRKNYMEKSLNQASFEEMVKDTIGEDNKELQSELVHTCMCYGSLEDAVKWTKFYQVPLDDVPPLVRDTIKGLPVKKKIINHGWHKDEWDDPSTSTSSSSQNTQEVEEIHTLPVDSPRIILVNTEQLFRSMIMDLRNTKMIAFDTEWKPTTSVSYNDVSLIQLAKRDVIYLVDVISLLQAKMSDEDWSLLGKWIFSNDEILKLGFAHSTDILMLMKFQPLGIQSSTLSSPSYLDLQKLRKKVSHFPDFKFPFHIDLPSHSLSNLVKLCLGKKLDKSNQFSNWQQRPLRSEQISYAALDAFCLFEIYDVIGKVISEMGINFEELIDNILIENKKQIASMTKKESRQPQPQTKLELVHEPDVARNPISVRDIRFVSDYMIGSIGRVLRQIGIDTVILKGEPAEHDYCIKYSQKEDRIILTASKQLLSYYQKHVKLGNCYQVNRHHNEMEGLLEIVKKFKINVKRCNVFSRCMVCNCAEFLVASKLQMVKLKYGSGSVPHEMTEFIENPERYSKIEFPENKRLCKWQRYAGERKTKYGATISSGTAIGTLKSFQTFYICENCAKVYWDGGHYHNSSGGKLDPIFDLFPEAEKP